jgi:hypothetical protein
MISMMFLTWMIVASDWPTMITGSRFTAPPMSHLSAPPVLCARLLA